jgi:MOSC domain-containing protein YiiM
MRILSVNVGLPRQVVWRGETVTTGIFKEPVHGRIALRRLNLVGDGQADPSVHGGMEKAVYAYPVEHHAPWRAELPDVELAPGSFGENLTLEGVPLEHEVCVGDRFEVGSAELVVTQPRIPCFKLGLRFGREDMVKRFLASGRSGWYFAVLREGSVAAGDPVRLVQRHPARCSVAELARLYARPGADDVAALRRAAALEVLPEGWRSHFVELAERVERRRARPRDPRPGSG